MLYLVAATLNPGITVDNVQATLNHAHSWYRFGTSSWVICTNEDATTWTQRLTPFVRPRGELLVCQVGPDRFGWMSNEFWTWWNSHAR